MGVVLSNQEDNRLLCTEILLKNSLWLKNKVYYPLPVDYQTVDIHLRNLISIKDHKTHIIHL
jgi:hypothetical protein